MQMNTDINHQDSHYVEITFDQERTIDEIILVQRSGCCTDRILDYNISIYGMRNGHEMHLISYDNNNNHRYFCEDGTYTNGNVCSFAGGTEINLILTPPTKKYLVWSLHKN